MKLRLTQVILFSLVCLTFDVDPCFSEDRYNGPAAQRLASYCYDVQRAIFSDNNDPNSMIYLSNAKQCLDVIRSSISKNTVPCLPDNTPPVVSSRIYLEYFDYHPEKARVPGYQVMIEAHNNAYPCGSK